jgi:hypothetical protein
MQMTPGRWFGNYIFEYSGYGLRLFLVGVGERIETNDEIEKSPPTVL